VAAALAPAFGPDGVPEWVGERAQNQRVVELLRPLVDFSARGLQSFAGTHPDMYDQATAITDFVSALGPGSSALVRNMWPATREGEDGHAYVVLFPQGAAEPIWWDPQTGYLEEAGTAPLELDDSTEIEFLAFTPLEGFQVFGRPDADPLRSFLDMDRPLPQPTVENPLRRVYGAGNLAPPDSNRVETLEQAMSDGAGGSYAFAHPGGYPPGSTPYGQLINVRNPGDVGRQANGFDAAIAGLSTFNGYPQVAASVVAVDSLGPNLRFLPELSRDQRLVELFAPVYDLGPGLPSFGDSYPAVADQVAAITGEVHARGAGASAYVHATGSAGSRSLVVVFPQGAAAPVWWDPQTGQVWADPSGEFTGPATLRFVPLTPDQADTIFAPPGPAAAEPGGDVDSDAGWSDEGEPTDPAADLEQGAGIPWPRRPDSAAPDPAGTRTDPDTDSTGDTAGSTRPEREPEPGGYRNRARPQRRWPPEWEWSAQYRVPELPENLWSDIGPTATDEEQQPGGPGHWWPQWSRLREQVSGSPDGVTHTGSGNQENLPAPAVDPPDVDVPFTLR
jgi:hypothetical protein